MCILVTGGAGYIGGHLAEYFAALGNKVVIIDNLSLGQEIPSYSHAHILFEKGDICDESFVNEIFVKYKIDIVIHCAGRLGIAKSIREPDLFYRDNILGTIVLLMNMKKYNVKKMIFSSSAAVYDEIYNSPSIDEDCKINPSTPYAKSKAYIEEIIKDFYIAGYIDAIVFRYFNVIGCESYYSFAKGYLNKGNLLPNLMCNYTNGNTIKVYGTSYNTKDGSCIRDYVDIRDLCIAHEIATEYLCDQTRAYRVINLCTNIGHSVLELVKIAESVLGRHFRLEVIQERAGDHPILIGSNENARKILKWSPQYVIEETVSDTIFNMKKLKLI